MTHIAIQEQLDGKTAGFMEHIGAEQRGRRQERRVGATRTRKLLRRERRLDREREAQAWPGAALRRHSPCLLPWRMMRAFSRSQSRLASVSRLSCSFLPRPRAKSSLMRAFL